MGLKVTVTTLDDIEEKYRDLYTEENGSYRLTGVEGMKTQVDIDRLQSALSKERNDHKVVRERLGLLGDRKVEDVIAELDRIPELEAAASGKVDDTKLNELVEARLRTKIAPVERELNQFKSKVGEYEEKIQIYTAKERTRAIHDTVRAAATAAKMLPEALEDALILAERIFEVNEEGRVVTRDNVGTTPGVEASVWLSDIQSKRPHWWGSSFGGGAGGNRGGASGGTNPWSADGWNMTEQGCILRDNRSKAEQLAKAAGTTIGGARPAKK